MNRTATFTLIAAAVGAVGAAPADAQNVKTTRPLTSVFGWDQPNAARMGVYMGGNDTRDTLGVLISSVMDESPASKAGLKEGDRIQSIDGVNLKMTREDAEDDMLRGMMSRRLTRELDKKKAGDEVELRVHAGGSTRTVRVKTVTARELDQTPLRNKLSTSQGVFRDRAALGVSLGGRSSKRDTLGVLIIGVTPDGPAEKAGIVEGDRIARINGMDLRVPSEDAGDVELSQARMRRLNNELTKAVAGEPLTLSIVSGGRTREVRVTPVKASELPGEGLQLFFGDRFMSIPRMDIDIPNLKVLPRGSIRGLDFDFEIPELFDRSNFSYRWNDNDEVKVDVREQVRRAIDRAREAAERARHAAERIRDAADRADVQVIRTPGRVVIKS